MKERIKQVRKSLRMSQTEFGDQIGATQAMITSYETGRVVPSPSMVELICTKFGISKEWLTDGIGEMHDFQLADDTPGKLVAKYITSPARVKALIRELVALDDSWLQKLDEILKNLPKD